MCPQIDSHKNVNSNFTHNGQYWETDQMSINSRMKNSNLQSYDELVFSTENQTHDTCNNMVEYKNHYDEQEKQDTKK